MNRRTFTKYLLAAPLYLATSLLKRPERPVARDNEKPAELAQKKEKPLESKSEGLRTRHFFAGDRAWSIAMRNGTYVSRVYEYDHESKKWVELTSDA